MSVESFLKDAVDNTVINHYLRLLAERQLKMEQCNPERLRLNEQALLKAEAKNSQFERDFSMLSQLQSKLKQTNTDLAQRLLLSEQALLDLEKKNSELKLISVLQKKALLDTKEVKIKIEQPKINEIQIGHFITREDGTALDMTTGLTWCRYVIGQRWENGIVVGKASKMTWLEAIAVAKSFNKTGGCAGFTDWRLPKIKNLETLLENVRGKKGYYINDNVFLNNPMQLWSSSPGAGSSSLAWLVDFNSGIRCSNGKSRSYAVRLVRG